jgi:UDP-glucose 4-epimerase
MSNQKNIIITGGAGFIGSHTAVSLVENGYNPIIIDDFRNSESFIVDRVEEITGVEITVESFDCTNVEKLKSVFEKYTPAGVIHFAADKAVGESVNDPLKYYRNNLGSLVSLLEVCKAQNIKQFVFSSSCTVYGEPEEMPVDENTPIGFANSPYGYTKQVCERICSDFAKVNPEFSITLLRYFNPIGAHPSGLIGELPIGIPNNLVPYITQTAAGLRESLTIFGGDYPTVDGTCIRDYIHVCDLASAHVAALNVAVVGGVNIYNVGTGVGSTVQEVVDAFEKVNGIKLSYIKGARREGDSVAIYADNRKVKSHLNWEPKYSLEDSLKHAWKWQLNLK